LVLDGGGVCVVEEGGGLDRGETDKKSAAANLQLTLPRHIQELRRYEL